MQIKKYGGGEDMTTIICRDGFYGVVCLEGKSICKGHAAEMNGFSGERKRNRKASG